MANHCYNFAQFVGTPESLHKLGKRLDRITKEQLKEEYTDKGLAIPSYKEDIAWINGRNAHELLFKKKSTENFDVYDEYGSKWFSCHFRYDEEDTVLTMQGDSAWSPMLPLFSKICKKYNLTCDGNYSESGMDFAGEFVIDSDGTIEDTQMTYKQYEATNNPDSFWDQVIYEIEEGYFKSLEAVYQEFTRVDWVLSESESTQLKKVYESSVKENES